MDDDELKRLDRLHGGKGKYAEWMLSDERAALAGPNRKVRVVNWNNLHEIAVKANLDEQKLAAAYQESVDTEDVLFVEYEEDPGG